MDDVSFTLAEGESLGIIGESGSGKTTLARIALGLEKADGGEVLIEGEPHRSSGLRAYRLQAARQMQIVFQDPTTSLDPRESLVDALRRILTLHFRLGRDELRKRVEEIVDQVGLTERQAEAQPRDLSGGQRQRVAIARAISIKPKVLVLDEAVSALDVSVQAQILNLLNDLRAETGVGYLFISHDLSVVRYVTDRSIVMRNGRLVEEGDTEMLLRDPQHPYTKLLIASVPRAGWNAAEVRSIRADLEERERVADIESSE
ncbi:ABC transporter ATP-binding protein [Rhodococcus rhodochrous]|uniref:ABC transporter ATP-binding protein n=1 Tax=Rhodococcus rhodochrous TaxID=1829 RepID=UPI001E383678|nr:ATP-binding cassette domain-containing protein [Rhodococcus rhodochrous]MCD2100252.1 ATP-binding cassette domain-containing protein [Rhodococcus rhodochrous]MCD2124610.1 ATP-binding cassette domain-containing protein [Rhodococcus rhodochrous]MCQ4137623.1 ATP-binding cassette domain-containing protein [Rhodococcus rhodochrous]